MWHLLERDLALVLFLSLVNIKRYMEFQYLKAEPKILDVLVYMNIRSVKGICDINEIFSSVLHS